MQWQEFRTHLRHIQARELKRVERAFTLGQRLHDGQKRKSGEPYFHHPIAVANMLADMHADADTVIAALLHDTVEDTPITLEEIDEKFDGAVARLINGLTKLKTKDVAMRPTLDENIETLRKIFSLMQEDVRIMVIKLVDRLHNMQTVEFLSPERQKTFAQETYDVFVKIADRLCMQDLRDELEALCLAILDHEKYTQLAELRAGNEFRATPVIDDVRKKLQSDHVRLAAKTSLHFEHKNWHQLGAQLLTEGSVATGITMLTIVFECVDIDQCYQILGWLHQSWKREVLSFEDFINAPQLNGYRGLHTTIITSDGTRVRCKIRTREMQEYARKGVATVCFTGKTQFADILPWTQHLSPLTTDTEGSSNDFWQSLKNDILGESILIHGPDDRTVQLPKGSTALDAAFFLFEDEALRAREIKVNGLPATFDQKLENASSVHLLSDSSVSCDRSWLRKVQSGFALAKIRNQLMKQPLEQKINVGKDLLQHHLSEQKKGFLEEFDEHALKQRIETLGYATLDEALEAIGDGRKEPIEVYEALFGVSQKKNITPPTLILEYVIDISNQQLTEKVNTLLHAHDARIKDMRSTRLKNGLFFVRLTVTMLREKADVLIEQLKNAGAEEVICKTRTWRENIFLAVVIILWGLNPVAATWFLQHGVMPTTLICVRFITIGIFMTLFFIVWKFIHQEKFTPIKHLASVVVKPTLMNAGMMIYFYALQILPPSIHLTILRFNTLLLPIIHDQHSRRSSKELLAIFTAFIFLLSILLYAFHYTIAIGIVFSLMTLFFYTLYSITTEQALQQKKIGIRYPYFVLYSGLFSGFLGLVMLFWQTSSIFSHPLLPLMILYIIFCVCITQLCYSALLHTSRFKHITDLFLLEVPLSIFFEITLLGVVHSGIAYIAIFIALSIIFLSKRYMRKVRRT